MSMYLWQILNSQVLDMENLNGSKDLCITCKSFKKYVVPADTMSKMYYNDNMSAGTERVS